MSDWLMKNISTICVCAVVAGFVVIVLVISLKKRKKGWKCNGCCADCMSAAKCVDFGDEHVTEETK